MVNMTFVQMIEGSCLWHHSLFRPGRKKVLKCEAHPAFVTRSASAAFPTAGVAKQMHLTLGAGHSGRSLRSLSVESLATAPPRECPQSTSRRPEAEASSWSWLTLMALARWRKPQ